MLVSSAINSTGGHAATVRRRREALQDDTIVTDDSNISRHDTSAWGRLPGDKCSAAWLEVETRMEDCFRVRFHCKYTFMPIITDYLLPAMTPPPEGEFRRYSARLAEWLKMETQLGLFQGSIPL